MWIDVEIVWLGFGGNVEDVGEFVVGWVYVVIVEIVGGVFGGIKKMVIWC